MFLLTYYRILCLDFSIFDLILQKPDCFYKHKGTKAQRLTRGHVSVYLFEFFVPYLDRNMTSRQSLCLCVFVFIKKYKLWLKNSKVDAENVLEAISSFFITTTEPTDSTLAFLTLYCRSPIIFINTKAQRRKD
jgi:hypothetical protein